MPVSVDELAGETAASDPRGCWPSPRRHSRPSASRRPSPGGRASRPGAGRAPSRAVGAEQPAGEVRPDGPGVPCPPNPPLAWSVTAPPMSALDLRRSRREHCVHGQSGSRMNAEGVREEDGAAPRRRSEGGCDRAGRGSVKFTQISLFSPKMTGIEASSCRLKRFSYGFSGGLTVPNWFGPGIWRDGLAMKLSQKICDSPLFRALFVAICLTFASLATASAQVYIDAGGAGSGSFVADAIRRGNGCHPCKCS